MAASLIERAIGAAKLDVATYEEVEHDPNALGQAMTVVVVAALASGIGGLRGGVMPAIVGVFGALVGWFIWAFLTYIIGTKLLPEPQTQADMGQLLRTIGFSAAPGVLNVLQIVPILGMLVALVAGVWQLVAMVIAVRQALDYKSTGRAVGVCLIGFVVYLMIAVALTAVFVTAGAVGSAVMGQ
jgi:hypothetical protein